MVDQTSFRDVTGEYAAAIKIPKKTNKPADNMKLRILITIIDEYIVRKKHSTYYSLLHMPRPGTNTTELKKLLPTMAKDGWIKRVEMGDSNKGGFIPDSTGYEIINLLYEWQNGKGKGKGLHDLEVFQDLPRIRPEFVTRQS